VPKTTIGAHIRSSYHDAEGNIWFASYTTGLYLYRKGKFYNFSSEIHPSLSTVNSIVEDHMEMLWIGTNNGLLRLSKQQLIRKSVDTSSHIYYEYYNKKTGIGMVTNEFNGGYSTAMTARNGDIVMATVHGLMSFNPKDFKVIRTGRERLPVLTVDFKGKGSTTKNSFDITKGYDKLDIVIRRNPRFELSNTIFEYRISNYIEEWTSVGNLDRLVIPELLSGMYTIELREYYGFGLDDYVETELVLNVIPLWYERQSIQLLAVVFIILCIFIYFRLRVERIKKLNVNLEAVVSAKTKDLSHKIEELNVAKGVLSDEVLFSNKLVGLVSHDIYGSMASLKMITELYWQSDLGFDKNGMNEIKQMSTEIYDQLTQILSWSKAIRGKQSPNVEPVSLNTILSKVIKIIEPQASNNNINFSFDNEKEIVVRTDGSLMYSILFNLLANEVKHNKNTSIEVRLNIFRDYVLLSINNINSQIEIIEDLNKFFKSGEDSLAGSRGLGLGLINNFARKLDITIEFKQLDTNGHTVTLKVPTVPV